MSVQPAADTHGDDGSPSDQELDALEEQASNGDKEALRRLGMVLVNTGVRDLERLERGKQLLLTRHNGWPVPIAYAAFLAVWTDHRRAWDYCMRALGEEADRSIGWYAYQELKRRGASEQALREWFFIVELSATQGFLLAKRTVFENRLPNIKWISRPASLAYRIVLMFRAAWLGVWKPRDARLPLAARAGSKRR